jgi:hypothetical protein
MYKLLVTGLGCVAVMAIPAVSSAQEGSYPVCTSRLQDHCQNPGEGGAPGRDRASDWKGGPPVSGSRHEGTHRHHHHWRHHHHS